jgi:hypothetical protein
VLSKKVDLKNKTFFSSSSIDRIGLCDTDYDCDNLFKKEE